MEISFPMLINHALLNGFSWVLHCRLTNCWEKILVRNTSFYVPEFYIYMDYTTVLLYSCRESFLIRSI